MPQMLHIVQIPWQKCGDREVKVTVEILVTVGLDEDWKVAANAEIGDVRVEERLSSVQAAKGDHGRICDGTMSKGSSQSFYSCRQTLQ